MNARNVTFDDNAEEEDADDFIAKFLGVDQYKSEGFKLMSNRAFKKATDYFKKSLTVDKDCVTTLVHKSYCNLRLGNYQKALKDVQEALSKQPRHVSALVQMADTFYFMGKLEEALVYFYRAKKLAPNMRKPTLWIYICESSILKTVGDCKMLLTTDGDMTFLEKQIEENKIKQDLSPPIMTVSKLIVNARPALEEAFDSIKKPSSDRRIIRIMGELYEDRRYMQRIFEEADRKTSLGNHLRRYAYAMIEFIDKQAINLVHESAPLKKVRRRRALPSITKERAKINQTISHSLCLIDVEQQERSYEQSLERAHSLLEYVLAQSEGVVKKLEEVIATIYGYIGNAYLQMKDLSNALKFFKKEKDLAIRHKLDNTYLHSMYSMGVCYVLLGEFKQAIRIWSVRLSFATTSQERCWLLHELGRCYYALCDFQRALELGEKAMEESKKFPDDMWRINCLVLLAQAKTRLAQFAGAHTDYVYGLEIACSLDDIPLQQAIIMCLEDLDKILKAEREKGEGKFFGLSDEMTTNIATQTIRVEDKDTLTELEKLEVDFHKDLDEECAKPKKVLPLRRESRERKSIFHRPSGVPGDRARYAYVTLATNDVYAIGALVLGETLNQTKTTYDKVVMITDEVTAPIRALLEKTYDKVILVDPIDSHDVPNLNLLSREELGITFTKINAWRLVEYDKCVFLDADTIVLRNVDELFLRDPFAACPDCGWPDCFNSGVFVYKPSLEMFRDILDFAMHYGSFDGGDQGLLNQYFNDWGEADIKHHLPFTYNMAWQAYYSYKPALKQYGADIKIIHYIGAPKPWDHQWDHDRQMVICNPVETIHNFELLQLWWDIFMSTIQPDLPKDYEGVIGRLANLNVRTLASHTEDITVDRQRQYKWERNEIDYMGNDRFENIQKKLDQSISKKSSVEVQIIKEEVTSASLPDSIPKARGYRCVKLGQNKRISKEAKPQLGSNARTSANPN